ncbi:hypothetical protein PYCCODRAFT_1469944 [Trametes coccinea BRFM310]|uniref:Uncharacterized protein n=1 Tax=Trametes coccinea (strain BRFM310) TaxID=1353009 RepID=A0A1Y2IGQ6_TRAC3|nr:hypothetical protein PYCCODRAFT_1469944 [Trametes coccinea BRFM310]
MSSARYLDSVQQLLRDLARSKTPSAAYKEILQIAAAQDDTKSNTSLDYTHIVSEFLHAESKAQRIVLSGAGTTQMVALTPAGVIHYLGQAGGIPNSPRQNKHSSQKAKARADYVFAATTLARIVDLLENREPAILLRDVRRLPRLVRDYLETVTYLEESNQAVVDQINGTQERLDDLVRRVA